MSYNYSKKVDYSFSETIAKVKEALSTQGFGVISEIDLKEKFKEKLNVDFREYKILGACNPKLAYEAIEQEANIGVLLPCNILVQENEDRKVEVTAINPIETMAAVNNKNLTSIAQQVSERLKAVIASL